MILMKINKAFILFSLYYYRAITILRSTKSYLTFYIISNFLIFALKVSDLVRQLFFNIIKFIFKFIYFDVFLKRYFRIVFDRNKNIFIIVINFLYFFIYFFR